jgi:predicted nuclease with TOPRIM domain
MEERRINLKKFIKAYTDQIIKEKEKEIDELLEQLKEKDELLEEKDEVIARLKKENEELKKGSSDNI